MQIDLNNLEEEVNEISRDILNEAGGAAHKAAVEHIKNTYSTNIDNKAFGITKATKEDLTFKIKVKGRRVSLVEKVVRVTNRGVSVLVKKGSPKFIRSAFVAPWQKGQSRRWLFINKGKSVRQALYTIGIVGMYKSKATMNVIKDSINKTIKKL